MQCKIFENKKMVIELLPVKNKDDSVDFDLVDGLKKYKSIQKSFDFYLKYLLKVFQVIIIIGNYMIKSFKSYCSIYLRKINFPILLCNVNF